MKFLRTFFVLALMVTTSFLRGQGHKYIPFPDSNAIWVVKVLNGSGQSLGGYQYFIEEDTSINGYTYHKVYLTDDSTFQWKHWDWHGLRNDTATRKVYMYNRSAGLEYLLYDFSLNEGDTIASNCWQYGGTVISNIDTFMLDTNEHLIYYVNNGYAPYIESIGSVAGLFEKAYFFEGGYELVCLMTGKDRIPYFTYWPNTCELYHWTGMDEVAGTEPEIRVYPSPLNETSVIELSSQSDAICSLAVYDIAGRTVFQYETDANLVEIGKRIKKPGMYFYKVISRNGELFSGKLLRQ